jgi:D-alanyl-D-alanine carboxypeptidase/D-alanyl-D-alanine-endopeptidase (penicillin-binding protein 4)
VHAQLLSELLAHGLSLPGDASRLMLGSLAVAGEAGTLEDRMRDGAARGRVRGKTGWINGASSLSGIAEALDGRRYVFSILVNYPRIGGLNTTVWKPMQDAMCERLVGGADGASTR